MELDRERRVVRAVARRIVGLDDADDVVQETFLRALASPPADTTSPIRPWLVTVARRVAIDWLRLRGRFELLADSSELAEPTDEPPRLELREILGGLGGLTRSEVVVLLLRDAVDYSVDETADAVASTAGSVRVLHHRARRKVAAGGRPDDAGLDALDRFLLWLLAHATALLPGVRRPGVLEAHARLLDAVVEVSTGRPLLEARARLSRGFARRLTAPTAAVADFEASIALGGDRPTALAALADVCYLLDRVEEARVAAEEVLATGPPRAAPRMHGILSSIHLLRGDPEGARRHVEAAKSAGASTVEAANAAGIEHLLHGRNEQAHIELLAALALGPTGPIATAVLVNLGVACIGLLRVEEARRWLEHALTVVREQADERRESTVLGNLATLQRFEGRFPEAAVGLERAIALARRSKRPTYVELWRMNLAIVEHLLGRSDRALTELRDVVERFGALGSESDRLTARVWVAVLERCLGRTGPGDPTLRHDLASAGTATPAEVLDLFDQVDLDTPEGRQQASTLASTPATSQAGQIGRQMLRAAVAARDGSP